MLAYAKRFVEGTVGNVGQRYVDCDIDTIQSVRKDIWISTGEPLQDGYSQECKDSC